MAPLRTADNQKDPQPASSSAQGGSGDKQRRKPGRVPVSCAECRRLKLRCDRQVPCESCTKRGCAALCPDGSLPTTKGPKLKAAAEVEELKDKISELENALRALQAKISDEPHPLLQDGSPTQQTSIASITANTSTGTGAETTTMPEGPSRAAPPSQSPSAASGESPKEEDDVVIDLDAFGTLTLGNRGEARFFGQTSRTEYLIHAPERLTPFVDRLRLPRLSQATISESLKELDVFCTNEEVGEEVLTCIPSMEEALRLVQIYFECSKFLWYPLPREYVYTEVVSAIYQQPTGPYCHVTRKHALSLLFMIFALATLFDLNMPPYAAEGQEYYLLARIALRWAPPAYDTTLAAIQSLLYMGQYLEMSDCEPAHTGSHKSWMNTRHAVALGFSIGLHVSSCKWQLDDNAGAKRSRVFWQMFTQDTWQSLGFGRPPSVSLTFVDCAIPEPEEVSQPAGDTWTTDFHVWTWQFTKLLHHVMTSVWAAKTPSYAKIMELDKRVREFPDPACVRDTPETVTRTMQSLLVVLYKETTHINMHRPYFSQALKDSSENPLQHKFGASVMIVYRSAWRIMNAVQSAYKSAPGLLARMSLPWSHSLACAILLCLLVTRAPTTSLASSALIELDKMCELFADATNQCQIASNNIHVLNKLRKQAHAAITKVLAEDAALVESELDRLGGKTQLIQTVSQRIATCKNSLSTTCFTAYNAPRGRFGPSVFEQQSNPNGRIQPMVARQDTRTFDDMGMDLLTDTGDFNFDFLNAMDTGLLPAPAETTGAGVGQPQQPQQQQQGVVDLTEVANLDWITQFLNSASGSGVPQGPQPQEGTAPVPSHGEMDATWQALVQQLGI